LSASTDVRHFNASRVDDKSTSEHSLRYIINAYRYDSRDEYTRVPDTTFVFTRDIPQTFDTSVRIRLTPGQWHLMAWVDYVSEYTLSDTYYNTSDFANISLLNPQHYIGDSDYREAFKGETDIYVGREKETVEPYRSDNVAGEISLVRPMGKFMFIATDLAEFMESEARRHTPQQGAPAYSFDVNNFTVKPI
jgi:hypothetical protein